MREGITVLTDKWGGGRDNIALEMRSFVVQGQHMGVCNISNVDAAMQSV